MATLPPGWAADYDGQRWFFRYTATNHTQYHFPTPGDEFPDFSLVGGLSDGEELLPEERLESERQVRKKATGAGGQKKASTRPSGKSRGGGADLDERAEDGVEGTFYFESFGYLGPGSYEETMRARPIVQHGEHGLAQRRPSIGAVSSAKSTSTSTSTGTGSALAVSEPSTRAAYTIVGDETTGAVELPAVPARGDHRPSPRGKLPVLDTRTVDPSPVGYIAELVSESTARCDDEINPPPVELLDTGTSWLQPVPLTNMANQHPVEVPCVASRAPEGWMVASEDRGEDGGHDGVSWGQIKTHTPPANETSSPAAPVVRDENKSAWQTNWMSNSTQAAAPRRLAKVASRSDLPSRQNQGPRVSPKTPQEDKMRLEIVDVFPAGAQQPKALPTANGAAVGFSTTEKTKKRHASISTNAQLAHIPSVLRPGPRRSSQQPPRALESATPPVANGAQFKAYQPPRPQKVDMPSRPHSQSIAERQVPAHVINEGLVMPNPEDHVRALRSPTSSSSSSSILQTVQPARSSSRTAALSLVTSHIGPVPLCEAGAARHGASSPTSHRASMPEPSDHFHILAEPSSFVSMSQLPAVCAKMPPEPVISVSMRPMPSSPLYLPQKSQDTRRSVYASGRAEHSPDAATRLDQRDAIITTGPRASEMGPSSAAPSPFVAAPGTDGAPAILLERSSILLSAVSASNLGIDELGQMRRIDKRQGSENEFGIASVAVIGEQASQVLPHEYIPPKGARKEASEWSMGQAE